MLFLIARSGKIADVNVVRGFTPNPSHAPDDGWSLNTSRHSSPFVTRTMRLGLDGCAPAMGGAGPVRWSRGQGAYAHCTPQSRKSPNLQYASAFMGPRTHQTWRVPDLPAVNTSRWLKNAPHALSGRSTDAVADQ